MPRLVRMVAILFLSSWSLMARAIEEPAYSVVQTFDAFEVREYAPYLVAEVTVPGPEALAGNAGFRILAAYIFGKNRGERSIPMTAPVAVAAAPTKIPMSAPVIQSQQGDAFVVQFTMPRAFTLETLPEPVDPRVSVRQVPGGRYAVIRYSGSWSERNYQEHLEKLRSAVAAAGLRTIGNPIYSRYNAPFVPWFMRRNEIWLILR